jgi:hypothetical protein
MPFKLIQGRYVAVGFSPDGDSVRFIPDNAALLLALRGPKPDRFQQGDSIQLRLEAIDALETHYTQGQVQHQPLGVAGSARDFLLTHLGIKNVQWNADGTRIVSADDDVPGCILSRTFEQNRRPVAFAYAGAPEEPDGADVFLDGPRLQQSVNFLSLAHGFVYPTYYEGLFASLRQVVNTAVIAARNAVGENTVWSIDRTNSGVQVPPLMNLSDNFAVLPKLFRRLSVYLQGATDLSEFEQFLEKDPDPCIFIPDADPTSLHRFVQVSGDTVKLTVQPEQLMFLEKRQMP